MTGQEHIDACDRKWKAVDAKKREIELARIWIESTAQSMIDSSLEPELLVECYLDMFRRRIATVRQLEHDRNELVNRDYREFATVAV